MKQTKTRTKPTTAPPLPGVGQAMDTHADEVEQKAQAARAVVLNELHDTEQEREAYEDLLAARDAEIALLQEALDKAQERRQRETQQIAIARARCAALTRQLEREHGNGMLQAAIGELADREHQLRVKAEVLETQQEPTRNRDGGRVLVPSAETEADIEALYVRMEPFTAAMNELDRLTREPIGPTEIRRRIGEVFAGLGLQVAA